jgi:hypothetical protein
MKDLLAIASEAGCRTLVAGFARREHSFRRDVNTGERARFGAM